MLEVSLCGDQLLAASFYFKFFFSLLYSFLNWILVFNMLGLWIRNLFYQSGGWVLCYQLLSLVVFWELRAVGVPDVVKDESMRSGTWDSCPEVSLDALGQGSECKLDNAIFVWVFVFKRLAKLKPLERMMHRHLVLVRAENMGIVSGRRRPLSLNCFEKRLPFIIQLNFIFLTDPLGFFKSLVKLGIDVNFF